MKNKYLMAVIAGLILMLASLSLSSSQTYQDRCMMMQPSVYSFIYTSLPSILSVVGILLVTVPLVLFVQDRSGNGADMVKVNPDSVSENSASHECEYSPGKLEVAEKLLEEDEKKVLRIITENEGITQDSLHFRTGFSTSKVSMIVKKLEEKDLIYRERFGKTYRLYLSDWLKN